MEITRLRLENILKWISKKWDGKAWVGLTWIATRTGGKRL